MVSTKRNLAGLVGALVTLSLSLVGVLGSAGCRELDREGAPDAMERVDGPPPDGSTGYPLPRDFVVPAVGSDTTFDLATWNIEFFPKDPSTPALVADIITSMRLDVVVVEEIAEEAAWNELVARLPEHEGLLSPHQYSPGNYQKLGVLYRRGLVSVGALKLLFQGDTVPFPRPPITVPITVHDGVHAPLSLSLIGVHLKAGVTTDDRARRVEALSKMETYLRGQVDGGYEDELVVLGDFNEVVTDAASQAVFGPLYTDTTRYKLQTAAYAQAGGITYLGFGGRGLDHILTTAGLDAELANGGELVVLRLDQLFGGYDPLLSDHLPVVLKFPLR
jgi:endonuclease/exonuclease/phosphatase family metal-dependent hydrolase